MRLFGKVVLAMLCVLGISQSTNAAFSFQLTPNASQVPIGGAISLNVIAIDTLAGGFGTQFTMSSATTVPGAGSSNITFGSLAGFSPANIYTATAAGNVIGSILATVSPTALAGENRSVSFNGTISAVSNGNFGVGAVASNSASVSVIAVPEPSSMILLGLAGSGIAAVRKFRRKK